jgi:hypothetical protein
MSESEIDLDNLPLAEALRFADEGSTTGGLVTRAALKTLAAGCRELTAARAEIEELKSRFTKLDEPKYSGSPMLDAVLKERNPEFDEWVASLPATYWARYDLSAARIGWEFGRREVTEQRDRLAEALKKCIGWTYRAMDLEVSGSMLEAASIDAKDATEALQSLTAQNNPDQERKSPASDGSEI